MPSTRVRVTTSPPASASTHDGVSRRSSASGVSAKPEWCMSRSFALSSSASAMATASQAIAYRSCFDTSCSTRSTLIVRANAIPVSISTSRERWLGVMSTVEKA